MMDTFMLQLLRCSLAMIPVTILYVLAGICFSKKWTAKGFYYAGIFILCGYLIPCRPQISILLPEENIPHTFYSVFSPTALNHPLESDAISNHFLPSPMLMLFLLWILGASGMLLYHCIRHIRFMRTVRHWSNMVTDFKPITMVKQLQKQYHLKVIPQLQICSCINSPMVVNMLHPTILLPNIDLPEEALSLILRHEMLHLKRKDLLVRLLIIITISLYWFHPAVYLLAKTITHFSELSCDEGVTVNLSMESRKKYALLLLDTAGSQNLKTTAFSTFFYGGKETMKTRISSILSTKKKRNDIPFIVACLLFTSIAGTVFTFSANPGNSADKVLEKEMAEAFSEEFSNEFLEKNYPAMTISYDKNGTPIVTNPDNSIPEMSVCAASKYEINGFYSSSDCLNSKLIFYIPSGQTIKVTDSATSTAAAKVCYGGSVGYMKKTDLRF